ncbi:MAG: ABC transporter permease, partial [Anaerolineae bacterium]
LILESPHTTVPVYDLGNSRLVTALEGSSEFELRQANSTLELERLLSNTLDPQMGLVIPANFDQVLESGGRPELDGYVSWANRARANGLKSNFERRFAELLGQPVRINVQGNIVYPPPGAALISGIATITAVTLVLVMGLQLVPMLLFEEKQTRTLDALLVSPANIAQVVLGKALAGAFYVLVAAGVVFAVNWAEVVHWDVALLFTLGMGLFAVAVGLVLGSFFSSQQEVSGWMALLVVIFVGAMLVEALELQLPASLQAMIPWVPSVALVDIMRISFLKDVSWTEVWTNLGRVMGISALLYAIVVWKVRRADR